MREKCSHKQKRKRRSIKKEKKSECIREDEERIMR